MFGLEAYLFSPLWSIPISILLIFSCDAIGLFVLRRLRFNFNNTSWLRSQAIIVGASIIAIILYPIALLGFANFTTIRGFAFLLLFLSIFHIIRSSLKYRKFIPFLNVPQKFDSSLILKVLLFLLLLFYGLLALSPITNADSLNYHVGAALVMLNTGTMPVDAGWFHGRLAGNGEVLNALGFSIGAEQFGSLLQYMSLIAILKIVLSGESFDRIARKDDLLIRHDWSKSIALLVLSAPVFVFLIASSKPQIFPASLIVLALAILIMPSMQNLNKGNLVRSFFLVCILAMVASQMKFSYFLHGGVVGILALYYLHKRSLLLVGIAIGVLLFICIIAPVTIWKSYHFGGGYIDSLFTVLPGEWPRIDGFEEKLRGYRNSELFFPLSLIFPDGLGNITSVIGIGVLYLIFVTPNQNKSIKIVTLISVFVFITISTVGQAVSRSYIVPFLWMMIMLSLQNPSSFYHKYRKWFQLPIIAQSLLVLLLCAYGIMIHFPALISPEDRIEVMKKHGHGYIEANWIANNLPEDAIIMSVQRSLGLIPRDSISLEWLTVGNDYTFREKDLIYLDEIKEKRVTHLMVSDDDGFSGTTRELQIINSDVYQYFVNCIGEVISSGDGQNVTRNPFNKGPKYKFWAVKFNSELLPNCVSELSN